MKAPCSLAVNALRAGAFSIGVFVAGVGILPAPGAAQTPDPFRSAAPPAVDLSRSSPAAAPATPTRHPHRLGRATPRGRARAQPSAILPASPDVRRYDGEYVGKLVLIENKVGDSRTNNIQFRAQPCILFNEDAKIIIQNGNISILYSNESVIGSLKPDGTFDISQNTFNDIMHILGRIDKNAIKGTADSSRCVFAFRAGRR
jgi:hypothetical protein